MRTGPIWVILPLFWCLAGLFSSQSKAEETICMTSATEILISVKDQKLAMIKNGHVSALYPVSTSRFGIGDTPGSYATPIGRLVVRKKIGEGCKLGTVFKTRRPTGEILSANAPGRDPIVTRILWLEGQELQNRHAFARCIYIHGTPQERLLGKPVSFGCVRMRSKDVMLLADGLPVGTPVRIIPDHLPKGIPYKAQLLASVF